MTGTYYIAFWSRPNRNPRPINAHRYRTENAARNAASLLTASHDDASLIIVQFVDGIAQPSKGA